MNKRITVLIAIVGIILIAGVGILLSNKEEANTDIGSNQSTSSPSSNLVNRPWVWQNATYSDGKTISVNTPESFILVLNNDSTFSSTTDCNNMVGKYTLDGNSLAFVDIASTLMFCEASQEQEYSAILQDTKSYTITPDGNLQLLLNTSAGIANFSSN